MNTFVFYNNDAVKNEFIKKYIDIEGCDYETAECQFNMLTGSDGELTDTAIKLWIGYNKWDDYLKYKEKFK